MKSRTNFLALEREYKQNEATMKKLKSRNEKIDQLFKLANELSGGAPLRTNAIKGEIMKGGMKDRVMKAMDGGVAMPVRDITLAVYGGTKPTQKEIDGISTVCGALRVMGKLTRESRGVYRSNFPVKQTATVGEDTRVTQVPPKREVKVIKNGVKPVATGPVVSEVVNG